MVGGLGDGVDVLVVELGCDVSEESARGGIARDDGAVPDIVVDRVWCTVEMMRSCDTPCKIHRYNKKVQNEADALGSRWVVIERRRSRSVQSQAQEDCDCVRRVGCVRGCERHGAGTGPIDPATSEMKVSRLCLNARKLRVVGENKQTEERPQKCDWDYVTHGCTGEHVVPEPSRLAVRASENSGADNVRASASGAGKKGGLCTVRAQAVTRVRATMTSTHSLRAASPGGKTSS